MRIRLQRLQRFALQMAPFVSPLVSPTKKNPAVQCKTCKTSRTWIVIDIIIDMSLSRIATIKREKRVITHNTRFNSFSMHNAFHLHSINTIFALAQNCSSRCSQTNQKNPMHEYYYSSSIYCVIIYKYQKHMFAVYYLFVFPLCLANLSRLAKNNIFCPLVPYGGGKIYE